MADLYQITDAQVRQAIAVANNEYSPDYTQAQALLYFDGIQHSLTSVQRSMLEQVIYDAGGNTGANLVTEQVTQGTYKPVIVQNTPVATVVTPPSNPGAAVVPQYSTSDPALIPGSANPGKTASTNVIGSAEWTKAYNDAIASGIKFYNSQGAPWHQSDGGYVFWKEGSEWFQGSPDGNWQKIGTPPFSTEMIDRAEGSIDGMSTALLVGGAALMAWFLSGR